MPSPRVIFLNGPSSSGKTTIAKALQSHLEEPYFLIGIDKVIGMMPEKLNDWTGGIAERGFWWKCTQDAKGIPLAELQMGDVAHKTEELLQKMTLSMLDAGVNVIVDEVCLDPKNFQTWKTLLKPYRSLFVGLKAKTETLEQREKARGDRMLGAARVLNLLVHEGKTYDLELHSDQEDVHNLVSRIVEVL